MHARMLARRGHIHTHTHTYIHAHAHTPLIAAAVAASFALEAAQVLLVQAGESNAWLVLEEGTSRPQE